MTGLPFVKESFMVEVTGTKPVSYIIRGLRVKDFRDEQRNHLTIRASLPAAGRFTVTSG
jgi:hypothetical protein